MKFFNFSIQGYILNSVCTSRIFLKDNAGKHCPVLEKIQDKTSLMESLTFSKQTCFIYHITNVYKFLLQPLINTGEKYYLSVIVL